MRRDNFDSRMMATSTDRLLWRADAIFALPLENLLYDAIFQRVKRDYSQAGV
jgi:hypothetical protein